ncbi:MAG: acyl-CoA dehydrogenase [Chloroflexi bacterium]|nr:acyl-CoA dehydrogenase [Chloroflexota bacterium]MYB21852.1 acyl-CoA dehydrogenase [Chloroflexota bacterium]MYF21454.1 acyl-CoA dehydrogenase [Chloroflexota bacterium]MYF81398.1 acyl-CoA dehydrogenase [Chloroflexota bacterium]MYI05214.1 acyl-CoA dehydrogenase [Chloroflexota bacterium]
MSARRSRPGESSMEYRFSEKALAFETEVNEFLDQEWTPELRATIGDPTTDTMVEERGFRRLLAERGWLTMSWPAEYGGQERSLEEQYLFWEAMNYAGAPQATVATQQVGPTLMRFGTDEQQERFLPPIARGEVEFALGYTEPDAGSDLASLQLRAVKDGDDYILNGIKRFTSGAHRSEYVWLATRTDPDAPKHRGVSMMLVDMQSAGITVKPLWTMAGYRTNEVYFEDVRVPTNVLVGEENRGWYYAAHALDRERISIFTVSSVRAVYDRLMEWARSDTPMGRPIEDAGIKGTMADFKIQLEVLQHLSYRILDMLKREESPNYEASQVKIFSTEMMQRLQNFSLHAMGLYGQLNGNDERAPIDGSAENGYLAAVMPTFGAGGNELQRNIIAQRGFGLPRA